MDPPDPGYFLHGCQVPPAWLQHHGPARGGKGAHLAGSRRSEGGVDRTCVGPPFVGISRGSWLLDLPHPRSSPMTGTVWDAEGEAMRGDRERGTRRLASPDPKDMQQRRPRLCCAVLRCRMLRERESREGGEIGETRRRNFFIFNPQFVRSLMCKRVLPTYH